MRRQVAVFLIFAILVVSLLWVYFYMTFSTNGLPMGWDTPYYVWRILTATQVGIQRFLAQEGYYHIIYPMVGSWISSLGLGPFLVEIALPLLLWLFGTLLAVLIVIRHTGSVNACMITIAAGSTWFAFFRLASDLHANLMALDLMLGGTLVFLDLQRKPKPARERLEYVALGLLVFVSSLAHVETTLFLAGPWVATLLYQAYVRTLDAKRVIILMLGAILPLLPGTLAYVNQIRLTANASGGWLPSVPTMHPTFWLVYLGPLGLVVLGALVRLRKIQKPLSPLLTLSVSWLILSLGLGFVQYAYAQFTPFSERAIMLSPTPFLAAEILPRLKLSGLVTQTRGIGLISLAILGGNSVYFMALGPFHYDSFISYPASRTLETLRSSGIVDPYDSVFIFHESSIDAGGIAERDNNWVGAYYGDHFSYFGRLDFLMMGIETPFADEKSQLISRRMFTKLEHGGATSSTVIYIQEFNVPNPVPEYAKSFMRPLVEGAYSIDRTNWGAQSMVKIPAYASLFSADDGWQSDVYDWSESGRVLGTNRTDSLLATAATISFAIGESGNYRISVRLLDAPATTGSIMTFIDDSETAVLQYNGTGVPVEVDVFTGQLSEGPHFLTLSVQAGLNHEKYAYVDFVSITGPIYS